MEVKTLNGKKVKYYDSIDELPIINYQKFNKYMLFSTNIGSDINSLVQHHSNILKLIDISPEKAKLELSNTMQSFMFIENEVNPDLLAFACLIYSIDDEVITDYSDTNLKAIIAKLKEERFSVITSLLNLLKKKLKYELSVYYPEFFSDSSQETLNRELLKRRTKLVLKLILTDVDEEKEDIKKQLKALDIKVAGLYKVVCLTGKDTYEVTYDKQFEASCLAIAKETGMSPYNLTVLQFYGLIENIQKQAKQKIKASKKYG